MEIKDLQAGDIGFINYYDKKSNFIRRVYNKAIKKLGYSKESVYTHLVIVIEIYGIKCLVDYLFEGMHIDKADSSKYAKVVSKMKWKRPDAMTPERQVVFSWAIQSFNDSKFDYKMYRMRWLSYVFGRVFKGKGETCSSIVAKAMNVSTLHSPFKDASRVLPMCLWESALYKSLNL